MGLTGKYADSVAGPAVGDILLDNFPAVNLSLLYVYLYLFLLIFLIAYPLFRDPKRLPFTVFSVALIAAVRALFITFTHLGPPLKDIPLTLIGLPKWLQGMYFEADLFFSGHVAIPFLGFLIFKDRKIKWFWLFSTFLEAIVNILMHTHYTIDLLAAPFISFTCFKFSEWLFEKKIKFMH